MPFTPSSIPAPIISTSQPTPNFNSTPSTPILPTPNIPPKAVPLSVPVQNAHSMTTRAKAGFIQPRLEPRLLIAHSEPKSVKQALLDPKWKGTMQAEYDALIQNNTWSLVSLPPHRQAISC
jgi:hypothetical protein